MKPRPAGGAAGGTEGAAPRPDGAPQLDHPGDHLAEVLAPLRRRALGDSAVHWALLAATSWAAAVCLLLAWSKLRPTADVPLIAAGLGAVAVVAGAFAWALDRPGIVEVARRADARLELSERLASALFFAGSPGDMAARLRADAAGAASRYKPARAFPLGRHARLVAMALAVILAAAILAFTPNPQASALARQAADRAATARARQVVASARAQLGHPSTQNGRQVAAALQRALSQLDKAGTPLSALIALSNLSRQLAGLDSSAGEVGEAAGSAAGDALAGAPGLQDLASDLSNGNLQAAATGLGTLAARLSELSPAQRKALAASLSRAAAAARAASGAGAGASSGGSHGAGFPGGLAQASRALAEGEVGAAGRALRAAAGGAAASASAVSLQQQLAADQAAVANAEARVAQQAQADMGSNSTAPGRQGAGPGARSANGDNKGALGGAGTASGGLAPAGAGSAGAGSAGAGSGGPGASGQGSGGGSGSGSGGAGAGGGSGSSSGPGGGGPGGEGGPGRADSGHGTTKTGPAISSSGQVFIAGQPGKSDQLIGAQLGNGAPLKTTPYQKVLPAFAKTALQGLGPQVISPGDRDLVRNYFSSLGGGG